MEFYDAVFNTCKVDVKLSRRLGFARIFIINRELRLVDADKAAERSECDMAIGSRKDRLAAFARGQVRSIVVQDFRTDKSLMKQMRDNGIMLCIPLSAIEASEGMERARLIYMAGQLFRHARRNRIEVSFITMAHSNYYMMSGEQMVNLATLLGADEAYARRSVGVLNSRLVA